MFEPVAVLGTNFSEVTDNIACKKVLEAECFHPIILEQKN